MRLLIVLCRKDVVVMTNMEMINEITKTFKKEERKMVYFSLLLCNNEDIEKFYNEIIKK